jgi:hypothetical protein
MLAQLLVLYLRLTALRLTAACTLCPCVIVPGEDLAHPATLVPRARDEATAIFAGRVVRIDTIETTPSPFPPDTITRQLRPRVVTLLRYAITVERSWKGDMARNAEVVARTWVSSCGRELAQSERYLIYATGPADSLAADGCSRVVPWSRAAAELRVLGRGFAPRRLGFAAPDPRMQ